MLDRAKADPAEIVTAVRQLRAASSAVIEAVHTDDTSSPCRAVVSQAVLSMASPRQDPASLPPIETLIGANPTP